MNKWRKKLSGNQKKIKCNRLLRKLQNYGIRNIACNDKNEVFFYQNTISEYKEQIAESRDQILPYYNIGDDKTKKWIVYESDSSVFAFDRKSFYVFIKAAGLDAISELDAWKKLYRSWPEFNSFIDNYYIKDDKYIIFRGNAKFRNIFRGNRYLINNSKVISFGVGKYSKSAAVYNASVFTVISVITSNIENLIDGKFLKFVVGVSVDIGTNILGVIAAKIIMSLVSKASAGAARSVQIPYAVSIVASFTITMLVTYYNNKHNINLKIVKKLQEGIDEIENSLYETKILLQNVNTPSGLEDLMQKIKLQ